MKIFIINLASATDRMAFQERQMRALGLEFERQEAVTAKEAAGSMTEAYWNTWERPLRDSEKACLLSHCALWRKIEASGKPAVILEDDALLSQNLPDLLTRIETLENADLVALEVRGRKKLVSRRPMHKFGMHSLLRLYQDRNGSSAYVIWPKGARKLLDRTNRKAGLADASISAAYELRAYQIEPAGAIQSDRCEYYGVSDPLSTASSIAVSDKLQAVARKSLVFRRRRILSQLRMAWRRLSTLGVAERRDIEIVARDFNDIVMRLARGKTR